MLDKKLEQICRAEGWWPKIKDPKIKWKRLANLLGYWTLGGLVKPVVWEMLPHEEYFQRKKYFTLKDIIPAKGECWLLFAQTSGTVSKESPIREDGFMLPLQWRSGEEVTGHDERLPLALRQLADKIKEQFQKDFKSQKEKLGLKSSPEEFYLYFSTKRFELEKEVPIFSEEVRKGEKELNVDSAWGALATGLYYAMKDERPELWPFSTMRYNFGEGEIERVGHIKEKLSIAACYENAGFFVATKEQKKAAEKKLKELQAETAEEIRLLREEREGSQGEKREKLQKLIKVLEKTANNYRSIQILCPGVPPEEKPLLIVEDIADGYAKIKRIKRWKLFARVAQLLLLLFILGIAADQTLIQTWPEYYADYVVKWGKPEGIYKLTKDQTAHRHAHYRFEYKGREIFNLFGEKVLRRVVYENAHEIPIEHDFYDGRDRPSILGIEYLEDNRTVHTIKFIDSLGVPVMDYSITQNGEKSETVEITRYEMLNWAHTYDTSASLEFFPYKEYFSGIDSYNVLRDENGFILLSKTQAKATSQKHYSEYSDSHQYARSYGEQYGKIRGYMYDHDEKGRITQVRYLDEEGKYLMLDSGIAGKRYKYDTDKLVSMEYFDVDGSRSKNKKYGYARMEYKYETNQTAPYEIAFFQDHGETPYKKREIEYENSVPKKLDDFEIFYDSTGRLVGIADTDSKFFSVEKKYGNGHLEKEIYSDKEVVFRRYMEKEKRMIEFFYHNNNMSQYADGLLRQYDLKGNIKAAKEFVCLITDVDAIMSVADSEINSYLSFKNISKIIKESSIVQDGIGYEIRYDEKEKRNIAEVVSIEKSGDEVMIPAKVTAANVSYEVRAIDSLGVKEDRIKTIIIPHCVKTINPLGLQMRNVEEIRVEEGNANYSSLNGVLFDNTKKMLILCPESQKEKVIIPSTVKMIENGAFNRCRNLNIDVEDGNTEYECQDGILISKRNMKIIYIPKGISGDIHIPDGIKNIGMYAFMGCRNLKNVTIPSGITTIGRYTFSGCTSLESVTIPPGVIRIEEGAFSDCKHLNQITIPDSVTVIGRSSFTACEKLTNVKIPDKITTIESCTFKHCVGITNVTIGKGVTAIGPSAFECCVALGSITIPDNVTLIGDSAFFLSGLQNITTPSHVTFIGDHAFSACSRMTNITILGNITKIGDFMFRNCWRLASITIPDSVTEIGESAFTNCKGLKNIIMGKGVTKIKQGAFINCSGLESFTIPGNVTEIERGAFLDCKGLKEIQVSPNNPNYCSVDGVLFNKDKTILVQYPEGKDGETYTIAASVKVIGDLAFSDCKKLETIAIPDNVVEIGKNAFLNCSGLKYITLGSGVAKIKERAFVGCRGLTSITIPDSVTEIGGSVFLGCSSLTDIHIPDSVTFVFDGADTQTTETVIVREGTNYTIPLSKSASLDMVWIEPGSFMMGSPESELGHRLDETWHKVTLTRGFWIGKYEVTQEQYEALMGENPSILKGLDHPVEMVSWKDAVAFCAKLTEFEREAGRLPDGYEYNLPTEAQWEYACRAGTTSALNSGKEITGLYKPCDNVNEVGWYAQNSRKMTHPVGRKEPNAWGLYDTIGNVCELCRDSALKYTEAPMTDPMGSLEPDGVKMLKGEGCRSDVIYCRAATRNSVHSVTYADPFVGFRLVLVPVRQAQP